MHSHIFFGDVLRKSEEEAMEWTPSIAVYKSLFQSRSSFLRALLRARVTWTLEPKSEDITLEILRLLPWGWVTHVNNALFFFLDFFSWICHAGRMFFHLLHHPLAEELSRVISCHLRHPTDLFLRLLMTITRMKLWFFESQAMLPPRIPRIKSNSQVVLEADPLSVWSATRALVIKCLPVQSQGWAAKANNQIACICRRSKSLSWPLDSRQMEVLL